jgi:hypothetical protein
VSYFIGRWAANYAGDNLSAFLEMLPVFASAGFAAFLLLSYFRTKNSNLRNRSTSTEQVSSEVEAIAKKFDRLMTDDQMQLNLLPGPLRSEILRGTDCDVVAGAVGKFGLDPRNPIPVNGPIGEVVYLSNLCTAYLEWIMFHRLGSIDRVDVYEIVTLDRKFWDIFYFDPYHPRK